MLVNDKIFILFTGREFAGSTSSRRIGRFNYVKSQRRICSQCSNNARHNIAAVERNKGKILHFFYSVSDRYDKRLSEFMLFSAHEKERNICTFSDNLR